MRIRPTITLAVASAIILWPAAAWAQPTLRLLSRASTGVFGASAAEIPAFDPITSRIFVVNASNSGVDVHTLGSDGGLTPAGRVRIPGLDVPGKANSVAIARGVLAVAANSPDSDQAPGSVHFYSTSTLAHLGSITVGPMPDMLIFAPDAARLLVANEGEPSSYGQPDSDDPEGSISIIDVSFPAVGRVEIGQVRTAGFEAFNARADELRAAGVRIFGPGASVAQDLEPEYIAVSPDSSTAYVVLQENNALAIIDIDAGVVTDIRSFGLKDHRLPGNALDPSDRDGPDGGPAIRIANHPVMGMFQPDTIVAFTLASQTYLITANEGDPRDYPGFREEIRVGSGRYILDPAVFPDADDLKRDAVLGRLRVSRATGDANGDGVYRQIHAFGARSFSIWRPDATLVYDSGDLFERITAERLPDRFNAGNDDNDPDRRSPARGPEPEGVAVGEAFGRMLAFIGLERIGGVVMADISDPREPVFLDYVNTRDFGVQPGQETLAQLGDLGPEGLCFIPAADNPTGQPLLIVASEVSGTTSVFAIMPGVP